jgi:hypothetical protein
MWQGGRIRLGPPFETTSPSGEGSVATDGRRSRRDLLKAIGAATAGAVAGGVLTADDAEASHGTVNGTGDSQFRPGVHGFNPAPGGVGVEGSSLTDGFGMWGRGYVGVQGTGSSAGIWGNGSNAYSTGVLGESDRGVGVEGTSHEGAGVLGGARGISAVGVKAEDFHGTGTALQVEGPAKFATAAAGIIPTGQDSALVSNRSVTDLSHITVTLTGDPGQASSAPGSKPVVVWVERRPGSGFIVHMSRPVRFATPFTFLIVEPV